MSYTRPERHEKQEILDIANKVRVWGHSWFWRLAQYVGVGEKEIHPVGGFSAGPRRRCRSLRLPRCLVLFLSSTTRSSFIQLLVAFPLWPCADVSGRRLHRQVFFTATSPRLKKKKRNTMSALLETSLGDIVIDLFVEESPKACEK